MARYGVQKVAICARNPIDRAFSHYWHEKKKCRFNYSFDEVLSNYDLWDSWVAPGIYAEKIKYAQALFGSDNVLVQIFDDLSKDPGSFYRQFLSFVGIEARQEPAVVHDLVNVAGYKRSQRQRRMRGMIKGVAGSCGLGGVARWVDAGVSRARNGKSRETVADVDNSILQELRQQLREDVEETSCLVGRDLRFWLDGD
jgi:hypothetical protein